MALRTMHLFAGAGGGILADLILGHVPVCAVEIEEYPRQILLERQRDGILPFFPVWDDIRTFDGSEWQGRVDVVSGGFPCQPFSSAARGRHTATDLWPEMSRVISELRPRFVFAENVAEEAIRRAGGDLEAVGYRVRILSLGAGQVGFPQIRDRWWLLGDADRDIKPNRPVDDEMGVLPELRGCLRWWADIPQLPRDVDGVAYRVDRLKAIGNGQVPLVAAMAFNILRRQLDDSDSLDWGG